ncbi:SIR2 family NAD-dependent protein deacylase [Klebsiella aerogenes]|uniref:SIR2 family NAD-dependent protein deacylase n=1 Tax=Klebsiella aerogenes TaxID=548 RepID=UPI000907E0E2|nr:SIR2 family protein [Klebsiella aerogenes]
MINWPDSLIDELASRRCVIFIGSGASASAKKRNGENDVSPPTWAGLLKLLLERSPEDAIGSKENAESLLEKQNYLDCAEILRTTCLPRAEYNRCITQTFSGYEPTGVHKAVEILDQKVVITTNFDTLYESLCRQGQGRDGYSVIRYYDDGLVARMRSPTRLIIKAHGCISEPEKTILTKSDFFNARSKYFGFFEALESIFLTHTILFIGYSVNDPEIQLILENNIITYPSANPHYATMSSGSHPSILAAFKNTNNIDILEYNPENNHEELLDSLNNLGILVEERRAIHT